MGNACGYDRYVLFIVQTVTKIFIDEIMLNEFRFEILLT